MIHVPVLEKEVLKYLDPRINENFIDCTIGLGGHTLAILEKNGPRGKVLGIDQDSNQIENCKLKIENFKKRVILVYDSFTNLKKIVKNKKFSKVSGILFDLGISSWHLEKSERGFSFLKNEKLDMRYSIENPLTAEKILNYWSKSEIEKILRTYSQERFAKNISQEIIEERKKKLIETTLQLVKVIQKAVPSWYQHRKIHPATRTFQALRITVNDELNNLESTLPQALEILEKEGKLVVISFHSLEDRIVKNFFRGQNKKGSLKILTKKPIKPKAEEIKRNRRARSAKLRAAIKII